jgi:TRAP-type C4-dicarboxylate transport system substrate-binding protein
MRVHLPIGLSLSVALLAGNAQAAEWNMATPYPDATFHTKNIVQFAEEIDAATDGALQITIHSGGSLIKHPQIKRAVQTGQVQAGEVFISLLGNEDPVFTVDSIPFLATSYEEASGLWDASKELFQNKLAEDGLLLLYSAPWPPQGLYTTKSVQSAAELKGLKFRAYNSATSRLATLTGMVPTQVEVPEIPQAFATGIVEAMITSPTTGVNSKAWDFLSHYNDIQAWIPKNMVIVSQRAFDDLDEATQQAVMQAAQAAETRGWDMSKSEAVAMTEELAKNGIEVQTPTDAYRSELQAAGEIITEEWLAESGDEGKQILEDYRGQ